MKPNRQPGEKRKKKKEKIEKEENATLPTSTVLYIIKTIIYKMLENPHPLPP